MSNAKPQLQENATRDLARFGARLRFDQIPREVVARMKSSVLDSLGCCILGATLPWTRKVAELAGMEGARPVASMIGLGRKTSAVVAPCMKRPDAERAIGLVDRLEILPDLRALIGAIASSVSPQ